MVRTASTYRSCRLHSSTRGGQIKVSGVVHITQGLVMVDVSYKSPPRGPSHKPHFRFQRALRQGWKKGCHVTREPVNTRNGVCQRVGGLRVNRRLDSGFARVLAIMPSCGWKSQSMTPVEWKA